MCVLQLLRSPALVIYCLVEAKHVLTLGTKQEAKGRIKDITSDQLLVN